MSRKVTEAQWNLLDKLIHAAGGTPAAMEFLEALSARPVVEVKVETKSQPKTKKKGGK